MKTSTYARLSLLIPLLIWIFSLLLLIVVYALFSDTLTSGETSIMLAVVAAFLFFYVIGIIFWIIPYLFVSLVLLLVSFVFTGKSLKLVYFLSPIVMAAGILVVVSALTIPTPEGALLIENLTTDLQDSLGTGALFAILALIWGYICVGLGFGSYMLLHRFGMIKEEARITPEGIGVGG